MHREHDPEASDCVHKQNRKDREDKEAFLGDAHSHLVLNQRFHLVLLLKCFKDFQQAEKFDQSTDACDFEESESLDYFIVLIPFFELSHETRQNGQEIDPKPTFKVSTENLSPICHKLLTVAIEVACVDAQKYFDHEDDIDN